MKKTLTTIVASLMATSFSTPVETLRYDSVAEARSRMPYSVTQPGIAERLKQVKRSSMTGTGFCKDLSNLIVNPSSIKNYDVPDGTISLKGKNNILESAIYTDTTKYTNVLSKTMMVNANGNLVASIGRIEHPSFAKYNQKQITHWRSSEETKKPREKFIVHPKKYRNNIGFPFGFSCMDEFTKYFDKGIEYFFGEDENALVTEGWRSKDGLTKYIIDKPVTIRQAFDMVERNFPETPAFVEELLRGKYIVEGGGDKHAKSNKHARGIMQISPFNIKNKYRCDIPWEQRKNEFAQIHCAHILTQMNNDILNQPFKDMNPKIFNKWFGHLNKKERKRLHREKYDAFDVVFENVPTQKREELKGLMLAHMYHAGTLYGTRLLARGEGGAASRHFAANHKEYSAADMMVSILFHNYGAKNRGLGPVKLDSMMYPINILVANDLIREHAEELIRVKE
jgi:hypothetical protein